MIDARTDVRIKKESLVVPPIHNSLKTRYLIVKILLKIIQSTCTLIVLLVELPVSKERIEVRFRIPI